MEARNQKYTNWYMSGVSVLGISALLLAVYNFPLSSLFDYRYLLISLITITVGSRVSVSIPRVKSKVTITDTFVFLTLLLFGGEPAIVLGAVEALITSLRISKKYRTRLFNMAAIALSFTGTVYLLRYIFGPIAVLTKDEISSKFILCICLMALVQYALNSWLVAVGVALRVGSNLWENWRDNFLYTSITYFAGVSAAAIIAKLVNTVGFMASLATTPIIVIVYLTYSYYLKTVEGKIQQVEQAQKHVEELSQMIEEQERISSELAENIAEQQRISRALAESEAHFRNAFDHAAIGMALIAIDGRLIQVNQSLCKILGYHEHKLLGTNLSEITHPDDIENDEKEMNQVLEGRKLTCQIEKRFMTQKREIVWTMVNLSLVTSPEGDPLHFISQIQDITERKQAEEKLEHAAYHDSLTGLANRVLFTEHLHITIEQARRDPTLNYAVLFIDLDRFKNINDSLGHAAGDELIVTVAKRLSSCLRPSDTAARFGGDEFAILLNGINDVNDAIRVAERLERELSLSYNLDGHEVFTSASIGIALSSTAYFRPDDVMRDADTAMYRAKANGKARYEIFDKVMHARAMALLQLENDLRRAVEHGEFHLLYQPIFNLQTGALAGFEALVRWQHPEKGPVSPMDFIPIAEETGLITSIGRWILHEACLQMRLWQKLYPQMTDMSISVNLSGKQFKQVDIVDQVKMVLFDTGLDPECLRLELTETVVMEDAEVASKMLKQLRTLGVQISIDDFGTGYSSLSYLHHFPIDILKIDRSFVGRMTDSGGNAEIARTIISLAHTMGMKVVAEGVEQDYQREHLKTLGCEYGQGYLFSKPINTELAEQLIISMAVNANSQNIETPVLKVDMELTDRVY
jgi:diguanylate cyclase (GGDEF)-like protein/PAS domain S-box-containing protein